jgi:hypothetical protein
MNSSKSYLHPYACFSCRRSFKRPYERGIENRPCPHCGAQAVALNRKFKAPRRDDLDQWRKVEFLVHHGFRFQSLSDGEGHFIAYPETLNEAMEFVRRYGSMVAKGGDA